MMIRYWRIPFVFALLAIAGIAAFAQVQGTDELRLRDGTVIRGEAVSHDANTVVFRTAAGVKTYARRDVASIVFGGVPGTGGVPTGISAGPGLRVKRWYTWRKLLDNPRDGKAKRISYAKISGDGTIVVCCGPDGVFTVSPEAPGMVSLTAEPTQRCDISDDGRFVVFYNEKNGMMLAMSDGSGRSPVRTDLKPTALRISGAGKAIYALDPEKDGIFRLSLDGSNARRVVSTADAAKANGVDANRNHWRADSLDVSDDGRHIVFRFLWDGFALDVESARLRQMTHFLTPEDRNLVTARVSPDGSKVAYLYYASPEQHFITVQDWSGTNIVTHSALGPSMGDMELLSDGSVFGGGSFVRFLRSDGRTREEIFSFAEAPMFDNPHGASSTTDGKRMILLTEGVVSQDQGRGTQIYVIDANPPSLAGFPTLNNVRANPAAVPVDGSKTATISARVAGGGSDGAPLNMVYAFLMRENMLGYDVNLARYSGDGWLVDDATRGDATAKDGIYTGNQFTPHQYVTRPIEPGPLTLRVFARTKTGSMTVVDLEGMEAHRP